MVICYVVLSACAGREKKHELRVAITGAKPLSPRERTFLRLNATGTWVGFGIRVPFRVLFIRVPYYFGDLKRPPNLENYPFARYNKGLKQLVPWV